MQWDAVESAAVIVASVIAIVGTPILVVLAYLGPRDEPPRDRTVVIIEQVHVVVLPPADVHAQEQTWREGDTSETAISREQDSAHPRVYDQFAD